MTGRALPFRPKPLADELLSSWIVRLAHGNHCGVEEFCRYLGFKKGRAPEFREEVADLDLNRLSCAARIPEAEVHAMTIPKLIHPRTLIIANSDFQYCSKCRLEKPGIVLKHWRYAWSMDCQTCGTRLVMKSPLAGDRSKLQNRATRGARALRTTLDRGNAWATRRIELTTYFIQSIGLVGQNPLTSANEGERLTALCALANADSRPLVAAALALNGQAAPVRVLRKNFPRYRPVILRLMELSFGLQKRLPKPTRQPLEFEGADNHASPFIPSPKALAAARQAIRELGNTATQRSLRKRASALWQDTETSPQT